MPIGTAFHDRSLAACESLSYRDWSGYYSAAAYETTHEYQYHAIRHSAALIDVSPLFKYRISGPDATRLVNRVITRDITKVRVGQVIYTPWCDEEGAVIDDGTVTRLEENTYRWTAADPNLRWFKQNAQGLDVQIDDISEKLAALAVQGPMSAQLLAQVLDVPLAGIRYFGATRGAIAGVPVDVSRTGYTGDLGFEIWMPWEAAGRVWDTVTDAGRLYDARPCGLLALDVARIEAGLLLIEVDFFSSKKALMPAQKYSPFEMSLDRLVDLEKPRFVGQAALRREKQRGPARRIVGLEIDWPEVEALYAAAGLPALPPGPASRIPVPVYGGRQQVGKATSTTWSPVLKKLIALATMNSSHALPGMRVQMEWTVEAVRHRVPARVVKTPFFSPPRKTATINDQWAMTNGQ